MAKYSSPFTWDDPDTYKGGKRVKPYGKDDLTYLAARCGVYEWQRQQLQVTAKLKGVEEEVVKSNQG